MPLMWLEKSELDEMETQSSPLRPDEKFMDRSQSPFFSVSLWELAAHPLFQNAMPSLLFTLLADTSMGITAEPAGSWLSGGKSVLLWMILIFPYG